MENSVNLVCTEYAKSLDSLSRWTSNLYNVEEDIQKALQTRVALVVI